MPHIAHFVRINAPIAQVFAFVADFRNLPHIQTQFKSVRLLSARESGLGAAVEARGVFHGIPLTAHMTIAQFEPPTLLVSDSTGEVQSHSTWTFREEPAPEGDAPPQVRATLALDYKVTLLPLRLIEGIVQRELEALTIDALRRLKVLLESPAGDLGAR